MLSLRIGLMHVRNVVILVLLTVALASPAAAGAEVPSGEAGVSVYVPLSSSSGIVIDGDLLDWTNAPVMMTENVLLAGADSTEASDVQWQVAADGLEFYFAATVRDDTIVAGQHGDDYWNEDSIELYVNFSGDQETTSYGRSIAQITISPIDTGNSDPSGLTISGNNSEGLVVTGYVFGTDDGWGVEVALDLAGLTVPSHLQAFGLQVQANGSSGADRDSKLSWSAADVQDTSYNDPSVFGTGIFYDESIGGADETVGDDAVSGAVPNEGAVPADSEGTVAVDEVDAVSTEEALGDRDDAAEAETKQLIDDVSPEPSEPSESRALLVAAVASAASIMLGGLWFERRRKASEQQKVSVSDIDAVSDVDDPPLELPRD